MADHPQPPAAFCDDGSCRPRAVGAGGSAGAVEHGVVSDTDQPNSFGAAEQRENIGDRGLRKLSTIDVRLSIGPALWPGEWFRGGAARSGNRKQHPFHYFMGHVL